MAIFYLDVDDEITGAVARLRSSPDYRVALVLPAGSRVATSRINFKLLAREAQEHQRRLAVLSPESSVRAIAEAAGLVAYPTVAAYEDALDDEAAVRGLPVVGRDPEPRSEGPRDTPGRGLRSDGAGTSWDEPTSPPEGFSVGYAAPVAPTGSGPGERPTSFIGDAVATGLAHDERRGPSMPPTPASASGPIKPAGRVSGRSAGALPVAGGRNLDARRPRSRRKLIIVVAGLVALLAGGAYGGSIILPSADIVVTPVSEPAGPVSIAVTADPEAPAVDAAEAIVPARRVEVPLVVSGDFPATGVRVDETTAGGTVQFASNNPLDPVTIPAGTTVATRGGVQFQVVTTVVAPKATISGTTITAGRVDARVEAVNSGTSGNVAAGAITVVPQRLANFLVSVANPAATRGGTRTETKIVTKQDYDAALKGLTADLDGSVTAAVTDPSVAPAGMAVFAATAKRSKSIADPTSAAVVGDAQETFRLTLTATATVTAVDESQLAPLAEQRLRAAVPQGYELFADSIRTVVGAGTVDGERVTFTVQAIGERWRPLDSAELVSAVRGKRIVDAKAALASFGEVVITPWPNFIDTVPSLDSRITITVTPPKRSGQ
jgi:hypothetical protein